MKILLEELPHQQEALEAIDKAFLGIDAYSANPDSNYVYANPIIKGAGEDSTNIDINKTQLTCNIHHPNHILMRGFGIRRNHKH